MRRSPLQRGSWWFIVYRETAPNRSEPLLAEAITRKDPVAFLMDYMKLLKDSPKDVTVLAFWQMDRPPTKAELEQFGP